MFGISFDMKFSRQNCKHMNDLNSLRLLEDRKIKTIGKNLLAAL
jgi:hypothetical protein